ncbi:MAG TPA: DUF6790 family protein [Candidatus Angelobacter sp.]|nr:DUF6790 family protein [Candidatus Angelobacter sp.]
MFQLTFVLLALIPASIHVAISAKRRSSTVAIAETYLLYFFVIYVGLMGVFTGYAHTFMPERASASIGWAPSPFEYEVGMADLTVGVLGILCLRFRGNFWLATAIGNAVWFLGDAVGHIREVVVANNHAANNSGIFLYLEIVTPLVMLAMTIYYLRKTAAERL